MGMGGGGGPPRSLVPILIALCLHLIYIFDTMWQNAVTGWLHPNILTSKASIEVWVFGDQVAMC